MADPFANVPRLCRCGSVRVDTSDRAAREVGIVEIHGLHHCFTFHLVGSHTSTVFPGEQPMRKPGCAGCADG